MTTIRSTIRSILEGKQPVNILEAKYPPGTFISTYHDWEGGDMTKVAVAYARGFPILVRAGEDNSEWPPVVYLFSKGTTDEQILALLLDEGESEEDVKDWLAHKKVNADDFVAGASGDQEDDLSESRRRPGRRVTEAFQSSVLQKYFGKGIEGLARSLVKQSRSSSSYRSKRVLWDKITDADFRELTPQEAGRRGVTKGELMIWVATQEHKTDLRGGYMGNISAGNIVAVTLDGVQMMGRIMDAPQEHRSIKNLVAWSDKVYAIDLTKFEEEFAKPAEELHAGREKARYGATALMTDKEFKQRNQSRWQGIMAARVSDPAKVKTMLIQIQELANTLYSKFIADLDKGAEGSGFGQIHWARKNARAVAGIMDDAWSHAEDYFRKAKEYDEYKVKHPEEFAGPASDRYYSWFKPDEYANKLRQDLVELQNLETKIKEKEATPPPAGPPVSVPESLRGVSLSESLKKEGVKARKLHEREWKHKINISKEFAKFNDDEATSLDVARALVTELERIKPELEEVDQSNVEDFVGQLKGLIDSQNEDPDEFDAIFGQVYNWADGDVSVWINTMGIGESRQRRNVRKLKEDDRSAKFQAVIDFTAKTGFKSVELTVPAVSKAVADLLKNNGIGGVNFGDVTVKVTQQS